MALHCVYGSPLSEKTAYLYDELIKRAIEEPEKQFILLVPEQVSLSAQQALIDRHPRHGLINIDILTFNRLAYRVFRDMHLSAGELLDDSGKEMLLRLAVTKHQEELSYLRRNIHKNGFLSELNTVVSELSEYNILPDNLEDKMNDLKEHPALMHKMQDIVIIYREFMALLHAHYELANERLTKLASNIHDWKELSKTVFYLDDFIGLTPAQYSILKEMIQGAEDVTVGLTLGSGVSLADEKEKDALFYVTAKMAENCKAMAIESSASYDEVFLDEKAYGHAEEICHLEHALFRYPQKPYTDENEAIELAKFADYRSEIRFVISRIQESVRDGAQYRENAIVLGDIQGYRKELEAALKAAGIPYFMDVTASLSDNVLFLLIENLLDLQRENYSFDSLFRVLKNPLLVHFLSENLTDEDSLSAYDRISEIENFAIARGFRGKRLFTDPWDGGYYGFRPDRLPFINAAKNILMTPVNEIEDILADDTLFVKDKTEALLRFCEKIGAEDYLSKTGKELAINQNDASIVFLHSYEVLKELLSEVQKILGEESLTAEEFREVMRTGLEEKKLGIAPPTKDRLVVGDLRRTRLGNIRNLFVMGTNEGIFPGQKDGTGLITDWDRELLEKEKIFLSDTATQDAFQLRFYVYLLLTKPTEKLTITYPLMDRKGKALNPSYVIGMVQAVFPNTEILFYQTKDILPNNSDDLSNSTAEMLRLLKENLNKELLKENRELLLEELEKIVAEAVTKENQAELRLFLKGEEAESRLHSLEEAVFYHNDTEALDEVLAKDLYGNLIRESVTRLETFAQCPQRHFLKYGLSLKEREEYELSALDAGNLYHDSLDRFFKHLNENSIDWREMTDPDREKLVEQCVEEAASGSKNNIYNDSARNAYLLKRAIRMTSRTIWALQKQWAAGDFDHFETELSFDALDKAKSLRIPLDGGGLFALQGKIDRLDTKIDGDREYIKVIDYKSGKETWDATKIYYGLQLQLLLYMKAAEDLEKAKNGKTVIPAGAYYYHIQDPIVDENNAKLPEDQIFNELKLVGITESSEEAIREIEKKFYESKDSEIINGLSLKKDGMFGARSRVMSEKELNNAENFVVQKAISLAKAMRNGIIEAKPFEYKTENACAFCPYKSICHFDARIAGFDTKKLTAKKDSDICADSEGEEKENG